MDLTYLASPAATLLAAGGVYWLTERLPSRRQQRERRAAVEDRLLGRPAVLDRNGQEITPHVASVHEELAAFRRELMAKPALNGKFDRLYELMSRHIANKDVHR